MRFHIVFSIISETMQLQAGLALAYAAVNMSTVVSIRAHAYCQTLHSCQHAFTLETKLFHRDCPQNIPCLTALTAGEV